MSGATRYLLLACDSSARATRNLRSYFFRPLPARRPPPSTVAAAGAPSLPALPLSRARPRLTDTRPDRRTAGREKKKIISHHYISIYNNNNNNDHDEKLVRSASDIYYDVVEVGKIFLNGQ